MDRRRRPKIGLALSGGGARGLAHIGVLKVLEREGIPVDYLAGTSMGGVVAAAYAAGFDAAYLEQEALRMSRWHNLLPLVDRSLPSLGLVKGERVRDYLASHTGEMTFDQLRIPLALVAVDLLSGEEVVLRSGMVADAVRATISLPGVFAPFPLDGRLLVDGGVLNNLPADVVREMGADIVIAVDVYYLPTGRWFRKTHATVSSPWEASDTMRANPSPTKPWKSPSTHRATSSSAQPRMAAKSGLLRKG